MAETVWEHHMRQRNDPDRAKVLLQLLPKNIEHPYARFWLVDSMTNDHWIPEMEPVLAPLLDDTSIELGSRHTILNALTTRVELNKYLHRVIRFVREEKDWYERIRTYNRLTNFGNRFFKLTEGTSGSRLRSPRCRPRVQYTGWLFHRPPGGILCEGKEHLRPRSIRSEIPRRRQIEGFVLCGHGAQCTRLASGDE